MHRVGVFFLLLGSEAADLGADLINRRHECNATPLSPARMLCSSNGDDDDDDDSDDDDHDSDDDDDSDKSDAHVHRQNHNISIDRLN